MHSLFKFAAVIVAGSLLVGCGGEDFSGAYRLKNAISERPMVLNVHGDEAEIFLQDSKDGRIRPLVKMKVTVKGEKLLLDDVNSTERLALRRNVDEQSLDCLNCKVLGIKDESLWKFDPKGPYNLDQMLKEQALKDEVALNAEMLKMQERIIEKARLDKEAANLGPYEGEWVYQRTARYDPLSIMTIWRKSQIKAWSFNFESMNRMGQGTPSFEVTDAGLKIGAEGKIHLYTLSADKKMLSCADCKVPEQWAKADPKKDLSDRRYARQMAGNPQ